MNKINSIAFLIVAHNKPQQLNCFIRQLLLYPGSYIYIHIDKKSLSMIPEIVKHDRVEILPMHYDVKWGDFTQITVNNYLLKYSSDKRYHDYYSLHSGLDLMIRPIDELVSYLSTTNQFAYFSGNKLPNGWQYGGGFGRIALYWPQIFRKRLRKYSPLRYFRSIYGRLYGIGLIKGRNLPDEYEYYGGADWFTISHECVLKTLKFVETESKFTDLFINSLSGAEIFYVSVFQMVKGNASVSDQDMLRYIDWENRGQKLTVGSPNTCKMDFLSDIENSNNFFARKFDTNIDKEIVEYFLKKTGVMI
ncbi:MAG: hypothetical protein IJY97_03880 [Clostridia bacterium]|nr:hypothetical protein [Clostridia bacterium]